MEDRWWVRQKEGVALWFLLVASPFQTFQKIVGASGTGSTVVTRLGSAVMTGNWWGVTP